MKAMILAAGRGERMRPLTDTAPKPLLKVGGKPLIVWHIENLAKAGFKEIVINHAHLGEQIEAALGDGKKWGVCIQYSPEKVALETAGGIANALPLLGSELFLVVNSDIFTDINFASLTPSPMRGGGWGEGETMAHLVMVDNPPQHAQGDFALQNGKLFEAGEPKLTFSGVGVYHADLFASVTRGEAAKLAPLLKSAMAQGRVTAQHHTGAWYDVGTPQRLAELDAALKGHN